MLKMKTTIIRIPVRVQNFGNDSNKSKFVSGGNSVNACYHSIQNLLSSRLLSKNLMIIIYKTIMLPVVLYGCVIWSLTLREKRRMMMFENRVLRRIFGPKTRDGRVGKTA
jgi:hypothetical protein